jgi:hypothetical protein
MNPWREMSSEDGRAMDERKDRGAASRQVALKRELLWALIEPNLPDDLSTPVLDLGGTLKHPDVGGLSHWASISSSSRAASLHSRARPTRRASVRASRRCKHSAFSAASGTVG